MNAQELEKVVSPLVEQEGADLVHLTYAKEGPNWVLRVFLDKDGGVTLDDCAYFSERIGSLLDSTGAMSRSYVLEVSSPGLDRLIKKDKDFQRFSGRDVRLRLRVPEQGQRNFRGKLLGLREDKVALDLGAGQSREFARAAVEEVRLDEASSTGL